MSESESSSAPVPALSTSSLWDFLNFRTFVAPTLVKIIYILQSVLIVISWFGGTIRVFANSGTLVGVGVLVLGGIFCVFGLLFVRVMCEMLIVLFRIYEELRDRKT